MKKKPNVLLILEGTYPYNGGGVSTWAHILCNEIKNVNAAVKNQDRAYNSYFDKGQKSYTTIPNVKGMAGMDAVALLGNLGIKVKVKGIGKVKSQSINPGASFNKNTLIVLELL